MDKYECNGHQAGQHEVRVLFVPWMCRKGAEVMKSIVKIPGAREGVHSC